MNFIYKSVVITGLCLTFYACSSGPSAELTTKITQQITSLKDKSKSFDDLAALAKTGVDQFKKELTDSLGEEGIKKLEKDSVLNMSLKDIENNLKNLQNDTENLQKGFQTNLTETQSWSEGMAKSGKSSSDLETEFNAKTASVKELEMQLDAQKQAFDGLTADYRKTISEIKTKLKIVKK